MSINDRYTISEAYEVLPQGGDVAPRQRGLNIEFTDGAVSGPVFELYQNSPNPFQEVTMISFNLPEASEATITIRDASGQLIQRIKDDYATGYNTVNVTKNMIQGTSGVLSYTVEAGDHRATRQMIVLQ